MLESKENEIYGLLQWHDKTCHLWLGQCDRIAIANLIYPQRNYWTTWAHYVTVACAANLCLARITTLCHSNLFLNRLSDTHSVNRVSSLVCWETNNSTHSKFNSSSKHIVSTNYIGLNSLHWEELTWRNLLQCCSMEYIINTRHSVAAWL